MPAVLLPLTADEAAEAARAFDAYGTPTASPMLIKSWQYRLGFRGEEVDGIPGPNTRAALRANSPQPACPPAVFDALVVEKVLLAAGVQQSRARAHAARLARALADYEINTPLRVAHFIAQVLVESGSLRWMEELWGPTPAQKAYEGRRDLGNVQKGDGHRYRGRGPLQVTGRANYAKLAEHLKAKGDPNWDVVTEPERVANEHAFSAAGEWWSRNKANAIADEGDKVAAVRRVSRLVNRGNANSSKAANHEAERVEAFRSVARAMREAGVWL